MLLACLFVSVESKFGELRQVQLTFGLYVTSRVRKQKLVASWVWPHFTSPKFTLLSTEGALRHRVLRKRTRVRTVHLALQTNSGNISLHIAKVRPPSLVCLTLEFSSIQSSSTSSMILDHAKTSPILGIKHRLPSSLIYLQWNSSRSTNLSTLVNFLTPHSLTKCSFEPLSSFSRSILPLSSLFLAPTPTCHPPFQVYPCPSLVFLFPLRTRRL